MNTSKKTYLLVECAVMIALSAILSLIKVWTMPMGGSVTLLSMLPVCYFAVKNGTGWGLTCSFVYALVQIALDIGGIMSWGLTAQIFIGTLIFDYILAYGVLGLSGVFGNKSLIKVAAGISLSVFIRLIFHFISGCIFFGTWENGTWAVISYSAAYNGTYMLPELVFTVVGAVAIHPYITRFLKFKRV